MKKTISTSFKLNRQISCRQITFLLHKNSNNLFITINFDKNTIVSMLIYASSSVVAQISTKRYFCGKTSKVNNMISKQTTTGVHRLKPKRRIKNTHYFAPAYNLFTWLVQRFSGLKSFDNFSIKNSIELSNKIKNIKISANESLVSFDIKFYFPSVPVDKAMVALQNWLDQQYINHLEREALSELTTIWMKQTYFGFRNKFHLWYCCSKWLQ